MPSLLFESSDDLKVSTLDTESETIKISMENHLDEAEYSLLEICLSYEEIKMLSEWISTAEYKLRDIIKNKESNATH